MINTPIPIGYCKVIITQQIKPKKLHIIGGLFKRNPFYPP